MKLKAKKTLMINFKNKILIIFLFILINLSTLYIPLSLATDENANANSTDSIEISAPSAIMINMNTGKILYSKNANDKMYPASTTKILTAILTVENCEMSDIATVSHDAIFKVPSRLC